MFEPLCLRAGIAIVLFTGFMACTEGGVADAREHVAVQEGRQAVAIPPDAHCTALTDNGEDYWLCSDPRTYAQAKRSCQTIGMALVKLENAQQNAKLLESIAWDTWIGANDYALEGDWRWSDGTLFFRAALFGEPTVGKYSNWAPLEPNNLANEDCGSIGVLDGLWRDRDCQMKMHYVCQGDFDAPRPLPVPDANCSSAIHNGHVYTVCPKRRPWAEARARCMAAGMDLANLSDVAEASFVATQITQDTYFGLNDHEEEGVWRASDDNHTVWCGTGAGALTPESYAHWSPGEPRDRSASCEKFSHAERDYWFCTGGLTWQRAASACADAGMTLATIESVTEQAFIQQRLSSKRMVGGTWIGGADSVTEGTWKWPSGQTFWQDGAASEAFANWDFTEPNNFGNQDCAMVAADGRWGDVSCSSSHPFVCEGPASSEEKAFPQTPDTSDCARISVLNGRWVSSECHEPRAYVCEQLESDLAPLGSALSDATLSRSESFVRGHADVVSAEFEPLFNVRHPFLTYERAFGLRPCLDTFAPKGAPFTGADGSVERTYQQLFRGVPVLGGSYGVVSDRNSRAVRRMTGSAMFGVTGSTTPVVTSSQAASNVAVALGVTTSVVQASPAPELTFVLKPTTVDEQWELAWVFGAVPVKGLGGPLAVLVSRVYRIAVSAVDGAILHRGSNFSDD